ncbi:Hypothetical protein NTJ_11159 [Nesidiocoris tenuis]|uniref:Uncharacterized protein n=1 Tax=Nesidiocoris tenuis TaxID=355587 RepID=A0ABN7B3B2_9HEMI|nr:Hypothetical protein NTJ_11159 [Nesidiocoris tenuis]
MTILELNRLKNVDDENSDEIFVDVETVEEKAPQNGTSLEQDHNLVPMEDAVPGNGTGNCPVEAEGAGCVLEQSPTEEPADVLMAAKDTGSDLTKSEETADVQITVTDPVPEQVPATAPVPTEDSSGSPADERLVPEDERLVRELSESAYPIVVIERLSQQTIDMRTRLRLKRQRRSSVSDSDDDDGDDNWTPRPRQYNSRSSHFPKESHETVLRRIDQTLAKFYDFTAEARKRKVKSYYDSLQFEQKLRWLPKARYSYVHANLRRCSRS